MADVIMAMLAKNPEHRPSSIDTVADELRSLNMDDPVSRRPGPETTEVKIRILVADDEPSIWELISYVFEDHGYDIVCVENGERALEELNHSTFDIVIADKNMPKVDGLELLTRAKQLRPATDFVMITGYPAMDAAVHALNHGAVKFLQKPFDIDDLARTIEHLASRHTVLRSTESLADSIRIISSLNHAQSLSNT